MKVAITIADAAGLEGALAAADVAATQITVGGTRLYVRERDGVREAMRLHSTGWRELALGVAPTTQVLFTDALLLTLDVGAHDGGGTAIYLRLLAARGPVASVRLPSWVIGDGDPLARGISWTAHIAPAAKALVITGAHVATLTFAQLLSLHAGIAALPPRSMIEIVADLPDDRGNGEVVVTQGHNQGDFAKRDVELEDRAGAKLRAKTFAGPPILTGARYQLRDPDGAFPLLVGVGGPGAGTIRVEHLSMLRAGAGGARAPVFEPLRVRPTAWVTPGDRARGFVTEPVTARVKRLGELGLAPDLDRDALDEAITAALGNRHMAPYHGAVGAAMILLAHLARHPLPEDRALLGKDAIARASRGDVELAAAGATRRWAMIMTNEYEPLLLCLEPAERATIEREGLLLIEPVPAYIPPPLDLAAAVAAIAQLLELPAADIVLGTDGAVTLSVQAASALAAKLDDPAEA